MKEINNNISEPFCSIEISKLLRNKGFDALTNDYYNPDFDDVTVHQISELEGRVVEHNGDRYYTTNSLLREKGGWDEDKDEWIDYISAPTHSLAIRWIRENFRVDISAHVSSSGKFCYELRKIKEDAAHGWERETGIYGFDTHEEAESAALLYVLTNLI